MPFLKSFNSGVSSFRQLVSGTVVCILIVSYSAHNGILNMYKVIWTKCWHIGGHQIHAQMCCGKGDRIEISFVFELQEKD